MNLPNKLTVGRIIATPLFMLAMLIPFPGHFPAALILFVLASITDFLDGRIARKNNLVTDFGKFLDPLADKMLTTSAYLGFLFVYAGKSSVMGFVVTAVLFLILFREFMVSSLRLVTVSSKGQVVAANIWGKSKTVSQMVGLIFALAVYTFCSGAQVPAVLDWIILGLFMLSAVLSTVSGCIYLNQCKDSINSSK